MTVFEIRPQGVDLIIREYIENATLSKPVKVQRVVFLCFKTLSDKRKYECQQCKNEHTKSHKVFKIKWFLVH